LKVAVIGGGAAGFFATLSVKHHHPQAEVILCEKSNKLLSKVKVSGGGRCNVTHDAMERSYLIEHYPRGRSFLKKAFHQFQVADTIDWFQSRGVELKVEEDGRMFPTTNDSQTIIDCFMSEAEKTGVRILTGITIERLVPEKGRWRLIHSEGELKMDKIIVATGGSPKATGFQWLEELSIPIVPPVPSLFTFNLKDKAICALAGVSKSNVDVRIQGTKFQKDGALLITHWGFSGPAVLKLSAFAARELAERSYTFDVRLRWLGQYDEETWRQSEEWQDLLASKKQVLNLSPPDVPLRLWDFLLDRVDIHPEKRWIDLSRKEKNRLVNVLTNDVYEAKGKTTFKEEFVTAGGVDLSAINPNTCGCKNHEGLYFAGEVLDIDGVTGGFNFQAAWTTAWIAGQLK